MAAQLDEDSIPSHKTSLKSYAKIKIFHMNEEMDRFSLCKSHTTQVLRINSHPMTGFIETSLLAMYTAICLSKPRTMTIFLNFI